MSTGNARHPSPVGHEPRAFGVEATLHFGPAVLRPSAVGTRDVGGREARVAVYHWPPT